MLTKPPENRDPGPQKASPLPSVDRVAQSPDLMPVIAAHGRAAVIDAIRDVIAEKRAAREEADVGPVATAAAARVARTMAPSLRPVFNLTGTVLHTNLGRAAMPEEAVAAAHMAMAGQVNLEYDLAAGGRGERDDHVRRWLCRLTGAEDATVVNNNAAAVVLVLNSLAQRREVPVSRGELIEIGGAFRMPDIMSRSGCKLVEVGTTNRTHLKDFEGAIGPRTAMLMKVHPSNYAIAGFTKAVPDEDLAALAQRHAIPYVVDLGSGTLVDLARYGLPHEPTPQETLKAGASLVTFSGDKLLGGPQAGIIVGSKALLAKINRNPLKRALRVDKGRLAALEAVLRLYADPDRLHERLTTIRLLSRPEVDIRAQAERLQSRLAAILGNRAKVSIEACRSQIGSGSLPVDRLPSHALVLDVAGGGRALKTFAARLRDLPKPVIGRIEDNLIKLDLRCLDDEEGLVAAFTAL